MSGNNEADRIDGAAVSESLDELLSRWLRILELNLRVAMPARVVSYNPTTQKVDARAEFLPIKLVKGEEIPDQPILFSQVPVAWPRGGGGTSYQTLPLVPNDTGYVICMDRALSPWLQTGNPVAPIDPISGRTHNLGDAVFIPGLHPDSDPITPPTSTTAHVLEGPPTAGIQLGSTATLQLAIASQLHTYLTAMFTAAATTAMDGGAGFKAALIAYLGSNPFTGYATTKVVGE